VGLVGFDTHSRPENTLAQKTVLCGENTAIYRISLRQIFYNT
jgi:hypothetical protein